MNLTQAANRERSNLIDGLGEEGSHLLPRGYSFLSPSLRQYDVNLVHNCTSLLLVYLLRLVFYALEIWTRSP